TMRVRPLARLDRLLRRWLPGYGLLRSLMTGGGGGGSGSNSSSSVAVGAGGVTASQLAEPEAVTAAAAVAAAETRQADVTPSTEDAQQLRRESELPALTARRRRDGEVFLDTGIAKSEFCLKLEKLLRAKLMDKD
ncbi:hypothetical protein KR222_004085, partial [Zaprionus bogoriensis]